MSTTSVVHTLGPVFNGPLDEGVLVMCSRCGLSDPKRRGHTPDDCIRALKAELIRLTATPSPLVAAAARANRLSKEKNTLL